MKSFFNRYALAFAAAFTLGTAGPALADYPEKPITLIVNFDAGSTTDIIARLMVERVEAELNGAIAVANRAGAAGTIGVAETTRAAPDGYTVGTANMPAISVIPLMRSVPYDPDEDMVHIASVLPYEYAIFARADAPYDTWEEFVDYVKENPGQVTFGGLGRGTTDHITMVRIGQDLDLDWTYVPFQGSDRSVSALLGGHVGVINNTIGPVASSLRAGEVKALLVTSEERLAGLAPDVPTMAEVGFDHSQVSFMSIIAPTGIPDDVRDKLEAAFKVAVEDPELLEATQRLDLNPRFVPGREYEERLRDLRGQFEPILEELGLREEN